jgi:hypothetical protein
MLLSKFVRALKPKIMKMDIVTDVHNQRKELNEIVLPKYREFNSAFGNYKVKSPLLLKVEKELSKRVSGGGNVFTEIESQLEKLAKNLAKVETLLDKYFTETVYKDALYLTQANLIQYISASSFVIRYSRNLMTLALIEEARAAGQDNSITMVKVEYTRLENQSQQFVNTLLSIAEKGTTIEQKLATIPNAFATDEVLAANRINASAVDPFGLNLLDSWVNPFYLFGMISAERDAANYNDAVEDFEVQQSLLLNLKLAIARQNDPKLEMKIQRQVERVQKARRALDDMEKKYGLKD